MDPHSGRPPTPGELFRGVLPSGPELARPLWLARHRALLAVLLAHIALLPLWALVGDEPLSHILGGTAVLLAFAAAGATARSRTVAASAVSLGLVGAAAMVVHSGDGRSVLHFHFFLVVAALALYRQWLPFVLALGFVLVDHIVMGLLLPRDVYDDAFSLASPWLAALVHGGYVLAAGAVSAVAWTWAERERRTAEERAEAEAKRVRDSERRLAGLLDHAPSSVFVKDLDGRFVEANRQMQQKMELSLDQLRGRTSVELFGAAAAEVTDAHDAVVVSTGAASEVEERNVVAGEERILSVVKFPLLDDEGRVTAIAGFATDITERTEAEQALRASERRLRQVFQSGPVAQMVLLPSGELSEVNPAFCALLGYDERDLIGRRLPELVDPAMLAQAEAVLRGAGAVEGASGRSELRVRTRAGEHLSCLVSVAPVTSEAGDDYFVGMVEDVTEVRRNAAELDHRATHDELTELPNRALLLSRIASALEDTERSVAVVFLDLDGFKEVNDSLGHDAGDQLLHAVAQRLDAVRRPGDTLARLGGDEFVLCCADCDDPVAARAVADRLLGVLTNPFRVADRVVEVGGSIGIALGRSGTGATPMLLLRDADTALYAAKSAGRSRAVVFEPALREREERRRRLQSDLVQELRAGGGGLHLEFQPVADALTGRIVSCEALIRWDHPLDGRLMPDAFLPIAADKGLLPQLDRWVLGEACRVAAGWSRHAGPVSVAVNVTPETLVLDGVVGWVESACARSGLGPEQLVLELTETAVLQRPLETSRVLAALRAIGVRIALDDFGTGYSSLSHLRDLPVDVVKIDRSFSGGAARIPRDAAIVKATVELAGALGAVLVAEGVETAEQQAAVVAAGCQMVQGWHVSRPLDPATVAALLARQPAAAPRPRAAEPRPLRRLG